MTWFGENTIETATGRTFDLANPSPEMVSVEDIAHGLAHVCRFGGHVNRYYSVAEHAVLVHDIVRAWVPLEPGALGLLDAALHHDDHEAYLGDVPRPMKPLLGGPWARLATKVDTAIAAALDLPEEMLSHPLVKEADNLALIVEARELMPSGGWDWARDQDVQLPAEVDWFGGLTPPAARQLFRLRAGSRKAAA